MLPHAVNISARASALLSDFIGKPVSLQVKS